jgi:hypothetical protein
LQRGSLRSCSKTAGRSYIPASIDWVVHGNFADFWSSTDYSCFAAFAPTD